MYRYYSPHDKKCRVTVVAETMNNFLFVSVARCSEKDRFVRKIGRSIAEGRLYKGIYFKVHPINGDFTLSNFIDVAKVISEEVRVTKGIKSDYID